MEQLLPNVLSSYVSEVQEALPPNTKLPSYQYGANGCFAYFEAKLHDLRAYEAGAGRSPLTTDEARNDD
eukprot:6210910-Pleurochrysis_carterae.AAC.2